MTKRRHINRELILVRIATEDRSVRAEVVELASLFVSRVVAVDERTITLQMVGNQDAVADFLQLLKPYKLVSISRSGVIAVDRDMAAGVPGVFAAGDVVHGSMTVVQAVADAKIAAEAMIRYMEKGPKTE